MAFRKKLTFLLPVKLFRVIVVSICFLGLPALVNGQSSTLVVTGGATSSTCEALPASLTATSNRPNADWAAVSVSTDGGLTFTAVGAAVTTTVMGALKGITFTSASNTIGNAATTYTYSVRFGNSPTSASNASFSLGALYETNSLDIVVNPVPVIKINNPAPVCFPGTVDLTQASITAGSTGVLTTQVFTDLTASTLIITADAEMIALSGSYAIKISNALGCSAISTVVVTINDPPTITGQPSTIPQVVCVNGVANPLTVTGTIGSGAITSTVQWYSNPGDVLMATHTSPTYPDLYTPSTVTAGAFSYYAVITNSNGCTATSSPTGTITINDLPVITGSAVCKGLSTTLTATGTPNATNPWISSNPAIASIDNAGVVTGVAAGTVSITFTNNNNCSKTISFTVNPLPDITNAVPVAPIFCYGVSNFNATFDVANGPTQYSLLWGTGTPANLAGFVDVPYVSNNFTVVGGKGTITVQIPATAVPNTLAIPFYSGTIYFRNEITGCVFSNSSALRINPLPSATINGTTSVCQNGLQPNITITGSGGTLPYTFTYNINGGANQTIATTGGSNSVTIPVSTATAGTFVFSLVSVQESSITACSNSATGSATVTVNALPTATITPLGATTLCVGGTVSLTASAGTSWLWSSGETTQTIGVASGGNFSVTVTNGSGCSATSTSTTVTVNALPTATITAGGATTFCAGGSVNLTGIGGISYVWSNGLTSTSINAVSSGTYSVTVSNASGCSAITSTTVTVNPLPTASITAGGPTTFCLGGSVSLTGIGGISYVWSNGLTSTSINAVSSGTYSVTVSNASGCSAITSTTVTVNTLPTATITAGGATTFCNGGSVTLTAVGGTSYVWSNGLTSTTITVATAGNYSVTATNASGCSATSTVTTVTVNPLPTATITAGGATSFCNGGSVTLTALGGTSYVWSTGATSTTITVATAGNYSVTATNASGCSATSTVTTVTVNSLPTATITAGGATTFCNGGSVTLTAVGGTSYVWSNGTTSTTITVATAGNYSVTATNASGCSATSTVTTVTVNSLPTATITAGGPTTFCNGGSVTLTAVGGTSYVWSNGATSTTITVATAGNYSVTAINASGCSAITSTTVTVNTLPTATITAGGSTSFCNGGSVTLTAVGGTSYVWSNGSTSTTITVATAGNYSVTATNASGCSATSTVTTVTVNALPTATITAGGPTTFCNGGSVTLTAVGGTSYVWSNGATSTTITVATAGNYSVTATNASGCSATSTVTTVTVNSLPTATITAGGPTTFCNGGSVTLTAVGGTSYVWSNGSTSTTITVATAGNYSVTATNASGCSATSALTTVTVNALPTATITAGGPTSFCNGGSVTLTAVGGTSYVWSNGSTSTTITVATAGNYSVTATNASGCSATSTVTTVTVNSLPTATITAGGATSFCNGGSVSLTAVGGTSYVWSNGSTSTTITVATAGNYSVTATNASGCSAITSTSVTVNSLPTATITAGGSTSFCNGGSVTLTAVGGTSYVWSNGSTSTTITVATAGTYSVTATNASGCSATSALTTVTVNPLPTATITAGGPTSFCNGGSVTLTAVGGTSYVWSNGSTSTTITVTTAGNYSVTATNASGCSATSTVTTVTVNSLPTATITAGGATTFCNGGSVTLTAVGGTSYVWSNGSTSTTITVTTAGNYSVTATNASGCSATSALTTVTVNPLPTATITAGGSTSFCNGGSVTLTAVGGTSYVWSNGATSTTITVATAGNYSVTATNASGCSATSTVTTVTVNSLPTATITAGGPTTFCNGGSVNLTASAGNSWLWSTGATTQTINIITSGIYSVTVTNASGCSATSAFTAVTVNALPTPTISASGPTTFCVGGSVNLTASGGTGYVWSTASTSSFINVTTSGVYVVTVSNASGCSAITSTSVTVNSLPAANITASGPTSFCAGGSVNLTASTGNSYIWNNGSVLQTISVSNAGNFSVTVTNASGCSATSAFTTVTVNALPTATITPSSSTTFCAGGSVNLSASGGASYLWSTTSIANAITVSTSGTYLVTVTNASGCSAITSVTVTVNPLPTPSITPSGSTTFCVGGLVNLTAGGGVSYLWNNGSTLQTIPVINSGNFSVTVTTAAGCSATSTITTVTVNTLPTATITAGGSTSFCSGNSVSLTASAGTAWLWSTGETNQTINPSTSGNYSVTVTNSNGCSATSSSTVITVFALPTAVISASGATSFCSGNSVNLTAASASSWLWSNGSTVQTININNSGTFSVTVTNANGCSATSSPIQVTVNALPTVTITASGATSFCAGGSVNLTASNGTSWLWNTGATSQTIHVINSGVYTVTVTNANGCSASSSSTTVTVYALPAASITAGGPTIFCVGGSVNLTASNGTSWLWNTGATTKNITTNNGGNYSVRVFDINGCSTVSSVVPVLVNPLPVVTISAGGPTTFCSGGSVTLTASAGKNWLWNTGETSQIITVNTSISKSVTVTDANGCSASSSNVLITVNSSPSNTIATSGATSFCAGGSVNLTAAAGTSWLWNTGETSQTITANSSGNRSVTITNANGCSTNSVIVPVTVFALPVANINANGPITFCAGGAVTLSASAGSAWLWNTGETTQSVIINSSTVKTVSVINANGCSATSAATVVTVNPLPNAYIIPGGNTGICIGDTLNLTASAGNSWLWNTGATTPTIIVKNAGNYSVTVTSLAGCSATSAPLPVIVNALPTASITASGPTTFCSNQTLTLSAGTANRYRWNSGEISQNIAIVKSGTYTVTVTDLNGCSATSLPVPVTVLTAPSVVVSITGTVNFCAGNSVLLTAGVGNSWLWTNGATTQNIRINTSGTYSAVVTASNGCSVTTTPTVVTVNALPNLVITNPAAICLPAAVDLTASAITSGSSNNLTYTYWQDAIASNPLPNPNYITTNGTYFIKATNAANCSVTQPVIVTANTAPVLVINHPAVCNPAMVDLTASSITTGSSSGLIYSYWMDTTALTPLSNPNAITTAGKYYIKGSSLSTGCTIIKPVEISFNALPNFTVTNPAAVCAPGLVNLQATGIVSGVPVNVTISYWKDSATTQALINSNAVTTSGTYYIKAATVAGCASVKPVNVSIQLKPTVNITNPAAVCIPGTVNLLNPSITAGSSVGTVFSYWKDAAATIALSSPASIAASGTYYIKGSLASGCNDSKPVTVSILSVPNINITNPAAVCEPALIDLTNPAITKGSSAGAVFSYFVDSALTTPLINPASVNVSGRYFIKASLSNTCSAALPVNVIVNTLPIGSIQIPSTNYICEGSSVVLKASSNAFGYQWLYNQILIPRATGASYAATKPGIYSIQLASQNGCNNTAVNSIQLDIVNKPSLSFTATNLCLGSQTNFANSSGFTNSGGIGWVWNFGDGSSVNNITAQHVYASPGTYNVSLTAVNASCPNLTSQKIIPVTIEKSVVGIRYDTIKTFSSISGVITARSFGVKYNWLPAFGLNSSFTRTPIFTLNSDNEYTVNIQSAAGCITTDTVYVKVTVNGNIYVPQAFTPNNDGKNDRAFPILVGIKQLTYFKIFNRWGNLVFQSADASPQNGWDGKLNGVMQVSGVFRWTAEGVDVGGNIIRRSGEIRIIN